ncbi:GNAT family N-acetyltransferase [Streptomyces sp. NPDC052503]|uniref:GNAT family N-acetyltransferase n=1 Tax=Streptomyces sp. NPDC052503 TaxID=3156683 RepID=UPI003430BF24
MRSTPGRAARKPYTDDDYPPPPGERAVHFTDTTEAVRAWVHGWALSRGAGEPRSTPWGFTVTTGPPANSTNHVLPAADETTVRELTGSHTLPGAWLKAFVPADSLASWITPGWSLPGAPGFLMSTALEPAGAPAPLPHGYRLRTWTGAGVTHARVHAPDGSCAARGQIAVDGTTAVVDKVETHAAHRRLGLGRVVMAALTSAASERGAAVGLLASSAEGRALYEATGWMVAAPLANARRGPDPVGRDSVSTAAAPAVHRQRGPRGAGMDEPVRTLPA